MRVRRTDFKASMGMDDLVLSNLWPFIFFVAFNMCSMTITFAVVMRPMIKQLKQLDKWHRSGINEAAGTSMATITLPRWSAKKASKPQAGRNGVRFAP
jgi:hypothetical protein